MRKVAFLSLILCVILFVACDRLDKEGSGVVVSETRDVFPFDTIQVCCGMALYLTQAEEHSLRIEAEDNLIEDIVNDRSGSTMAVEFRGQGTTNYRPTEPVKVYVTMPNIEGVAVSGGGLLEAEQIDAEKLAITLSGGSQGRIDSAIATELAVTVSGGGHFESDNLEAGEALFELSGGSNTGIEALLADEVHFSVSGGGRVDGQRILAKMLKLDLSGGSQAHLAQFAGDNLEAVISGGGRAEIAGDVESQLIDLSGGSQFSGADLLSRLTEIRGNGDATIWATESLDADLSGGAIVE